MKFQNVPVGAKYIDIHSGCELIKVDKNKALIEKYVDNVEDDIEVELLTKCTNCKHWVDKPRDESGTINYCDEVSISHNDKEVFPDMELADPETFSCSLFELLDK